MTLSIPHNRNPPDIVSQLSLCKLMLAFSREKISNIAVFFCFLFKAIGT